MCEFVRSEPDFLCRHAVVGNNRVDRAHRRTSGVWCKAVYLSRTSRRKFGSNTIGKSSVYGFTVALANIAERLTPQQERTRPVAKGQPATLRDKSESTSSSYEPCHPQFHVLRSDISVKENVASSMPIGRGAPFYPSDPIRGTNRQKPMFIRRALPLSPSD
jgi:hypothetical protein